MRGDPGNFEVLTPTSLPEALRLMSEAALDQDSPLLKPLAGGTDLMVLMEMGALQCERFLSLHAIDELRSFRPEEDSVAIGAAMTFSRIRTEAILREEFPLLCEAAGQVGALAIQNRGTLGGNIANASPAADSAPALLAYDAELEIVSQSGTRRIPYSAFHTGYKEMQLRPDELIRSILLPRKWKGCHQSFRKVGARAAQAISKVSFAGVLRISDGLIQEARIAMGSVAPTPLRCVHTERALQGKKLDFSAIGRAKEALFKEISPVDDIRSNREYRLRVSLNLIEDFLLSARK
ncbi:MAG: hypothetical protein A2X94_08260 [Bdellovibrionales bacterium GWB1_55_8]|nr:MAG: hypothetical protein A2X94_08260 [Bdellovibrionales bacterium GWB1_55_8]